MKTNEAQPPGAEAWLLSFDAGLYAAIGERELQHIVHAPVTFTIPFCPFYCEEVLIWNDQLLPVMDLAAWLSNGRQNCRNALLGVVAYRPHDSYTPHYAALRLHSAPKRLQVYDKQACSLLEDPPRWQQIAVSCFTYQDEKSVPILDLPSVFSHRLQASSIL